MRKFLNIIAGWFYFFFTNESVEKIAVKRIRHCMNCRHAKFDDGIEAWKHFDLGYPKNPNKMVCSLCKRCPISKKVRAPKERCPDNRW